MLARLLKILALIPLFLVVALPVYGQTVVVTGNLKTVLGESLGSNTFVRFRLRNFKPNRPLVSGVGIIGQTTKDVSPNSNGLISTTVFDNDLITPSETFYTLEFYLQSRFVFAASYTITGASFDFNTAIPLSSVPTASVPVAESRVFVHIQASAATTWTITHNFAVREVTLDFYDANFNRIFPDLVTLTDINTVTAMFVVAQAGRVVVMRAENVNLTSSISDPVLKVPTTSQSISGGFDLTLDGNFLLAITGQDIGSATVRPDLFLELGTFYNTFAPNVTGIDIGKASARPDGIFDVMAVGQWNNIRVVDGNKFTTCQAAEDDLGANPGLLAIPSDYAGADCTSVSNNVVVLDLRESTSVAGTLVETKFSIISNNRDARADLQVINPAVRNKVNIVTGDQLLAGNPNDQLTGLGTMVSVSKTNGVVVGHFAFAENNATGTSQAFGANFGVGNVAGTDGSITGLEIDVSNNFVGGGATNKIGLVINSFNNPISTYASLNGFTSAAGANIGILFLANAMKSGASAFISADPQSNTPTFGINFQGNSFSTAAIRLPNDAGGRINWDSTTGSAAAIYNDTSNSMRIMPGNSGTGFLRDAADGATILQWSATGIGVNVGVAPDGSGFKHSRTTTGSIALSSSAAVTVTWTTAFTDANYTLCGVEVVEADTDVLTLHVDHVESISASAVVVRVENRDAGAAKTGTLHVCAVHD